MRTTMINNQLGKKVNEVFNENHLYYEMMLEWHGKHDGLAIEPKVHSLITSHCKLGLHVLDAGCGSGSIINWFARKFGDTQFVGVDVSRIGIELAKQGSPANVLFEVADLTRLPFPDNHFDFAYSQSVLEHVVGWELAIAELHRVLRPGAELLIRVGNGGVRNVSSPYRALLNYVLFKNRAETAAPSFKLESGNWEQHEANFDVQELPSDLLLRTLRRNRFRVSFFTTGTEQWRTSSNLKARLASYLQFWPFNHLGSTTIVLARKLA